MKSATEGWVNRRAETDWDLVSQEMVRRQECGTFELGPRVEQWFGGFGGG